MGALDQIMKMKSQGMNESDIIRNLQQQGIAPNEINNALSQAQIKNAVSPGPNQEQAPQEQMQPSIMENAPETQAPQQTPQNQFQQPQQNYLQQNYQPQTQEVSQQPPMQDYYPQEQYYQPQNYSQQYANNFDTDMVIEISEQVFNEKIKNIERELSQLIQFKAIAAAKIENISIRLKKIETMIDKLQISILDKISSYTGNISSIKKEMTMMQDSFSKALPSIVKHHKHKKSSTSKHKKKK